MITESDVSQISAHESMSEREKAEHMYADHYADVFRYVRRRVGSLTEAEDLASDVFCRAVAGLQRYRPMRSSALPWLYTIAAHRIADHYRQGRSAEQLGEAELVPDPGPDPSDLIERRDLVSQVWALAQSLPPSQRRALWLRYGEQLELREIAARMGRSVEAVKLLVHRAVRGVRMAMALRDGSDPRLAPTPLALSVAVSA